MKVYIDRKLEGKNETIKYNYIEFDCEKYLKSAIDSQDPGIFYASIENMMIDFSLQCCEEMLNIGDAYGANTPIVVRISREIELV